MTRLAPKTARPDRTTPLVAARPADSAEEPAVRPVQQADRATSRPNTSVLRVAGMTSESLRNTSDLLQKRATLDFPAVSSAAKLPRSAEASKITVNNGTASAHAIA